jgi:transposase-like protein
VTEVLLALYLRGISTRDFVPALAEFFGSEAGLSASAVQRLTVEWTRELETVGGRGPLQHPAGGGPAVLPGAGGCAGGWRKELVAVGDGNRESEESWSEVLRDLNRRCCPPRWMNG